MGRSSLNMHDENVNFMLGPTNTGKTHFALEKMLSYSSGIIGLPLRLLAREVYDKIVKKVGPLKVALITGEERIFPSQATYYVATVEAMPSNIVVDFIAVDEIQLCNDFERGHIFTDKLLHARGNMETLFLGSDSMTAIVKKLFPNSKIFNSARRSKLTYTGRKRIYSLPKRSAIIAFRISDVYNIAAKIKAVKGGAAVVIGALSPQTRNAQVSMFEDETVDYIVATDAIGMGLNLNVNNVSMSSLKKYDGKKLRYLKDIELAQIVGRAGRNQVDGSFGSTLDCPKINNATIRCIEKHDFADINFLYWRSRNLDFSTLHSLVNSLEKKSSNPKLLKTLNTRDENLLKYLASTDSIRKSLNSYDSIKLLWEISTIPDYMKNLDFSYSNDLIKIFSNVFDYGNINLDWAKKEARKLHNIEGSIDMLTYRLSKIRFWNYISNKKHWLSNNDELKNLSLEIETILSSALHKRLTEQFVDKKIHSILKEYNLSKNILINKDSKNNILLNKRIIGKISGMKLIIFDEKSIFKNKFLKDQISPKIRLIFNEYVKDILKNNDFDLSINSSNCLHLNNQKVGSIYKGKTIHSPNFLLEHNKFLNDELYQNFSKLIKIKLKEMTQKYFWKENIEKKTTNKNIKAIIFCLNSEFGLTSKHNVYQFLKNLKLNDKLFFKNNEITLGKKYIFYNELTKHKNIEERWKISLLFFNFKLNTKMPTKNIFFNAGSYNPKLLRLIGYIKINNTAFKLVFLEHFLKHVYEKKNRVLSFNNYHYLKYKINFQLLSQILSYLGYIKIAGTNLVSYWQEHKDITISKTYNKNSPFYVLKKLQ